MRLFSSILSSLLALPLGLCLSSSGLSAFEFGYMGNNSMGLGGAGVALAHSPWSMYYNPALQSIDKGFKVGYSIGARYQESKFLDLTNFNYSNVEDIAKFNDLLKKNSFNLVSENGLALQFPIPLGSTSLSSALGLGLFYTHRSTLALRGNINAATIIATAATNGSTTNGNDHIPELIISSIDLVELPLSYALSATLPFGALHVGTSVKYVHGQTNSSSEKLDTNTDLVKRAKSTISSRGTMTDTYAVDVGLAYSMLEDGIVLGIVGKYLNSPVLKTEDRTNIRMSPQVRAGMSISLIPITTIVFDADLSPDKIYTSKKDADKTEGFSQIIALGAMLNFKFFDLRAGVAKDLRQSDGALISLGLGFTFIDVTGFVNTKAIKVKGQKGKIPVSGGFKVGGGFSF